MIKILVSCHMQTHTVPFGSDRSAAEAELARLVPLIGRDRWGKNRKEEEPTHTIRSPVGDMTFVLEKIEAVRLLDSDADWEIYKAENDRAIAKDMEHRSMLAAEGLLFPPK